MSKPIEIEQLTLAIRALRRAAEHYATGTPAGVAAGNEDVKTALIWAGSARAHASLRSPSRAAAELRQRLLDDIADGGRSAL